MLIMVRWRAEPSAHTGSRDAAERKWDAKYAEVRGFLRQSGGRYPAVQTTASHTPEAAERSIGCWVSHQREAKRGKSTYVMTPARAAKLEKLAGWMWSPRPRLGKRHGEAESRATPRALYLDS